MAVLSNAVVWVVSTRPLILKTFSPCTNPLLTLPSALITIGIIVTTIFHSFCSFLARSTYLSFFSLSFSFILWSTGTDKSIIRQVLFFAVNYNKVWSPAEISWYVFISKSQKTLYISFSWTDSWLCIYYLFLESNLNFLHNSQWITFPTQLCILLYFFYVGLLHSLIWLIVSFLSHYHYLRLFHIRDQSSFNWCFFTGIWDAANFLGSPRHLNILEDFKSAKV